MRSASARRVLAQNVGRGGLPAWTYDHDELMELEKELVFRRNWLLVGLVCLVLWPANAAGYHMPFRREQVALEASV